MSHNTWPFIGSLGRLVEVPFTASENVSRADRYVESLTVEGRRRVQVRPAAPRSWSVDVRGATGTELSGLESFVSGAWGHGPWHWVSVRAQRGNLLTPTEADLTGVAYNARWSLGGPMRRESGDWSGQSLAVSVPSGSHTVVDGIPVLPGRAVTYGADVQASNPSVAPRLLVQWRDAAGGFIAQEFVDGRVSGAVQRVSMTRTPPTLAASARLLLGPTISRYTAPQVTWTEREMPYSAGHGCRSAVVDGLSEELLVAAAHGVHSNISFTVLEVS